MKSLYLTLSSLAVLSFAQSSFLHKPELYQSKAPRIELNLVQQYDFVYLAEMNFGNATGMNKTHVLIDTQNDWSFIVSDTCTTCFSLHRYTFNESTPMFDFETKYCREIRLDGKAVQDKACVVDSSSASHCVDQLKFGVITSQVGQSWDGIDGVLGLRPQISSDDYSFIAALFNTT